MLQQQLWPGDFYTQAKTHVRLGNLIPVLPAIGAGSDLLDVT